MKKTMLWSAVFALMNSPIYADQTPNTNPTQPTVTNQTTPTTVTPTTANTPTAAVINCDYKIPAETKQIEQSLVVTWSEKATLQAFDFDPNLIDVQMQKLKSCFTDQGWTSFDTALQKSGNVEAIKSQRLMVSSLVDGQVQVVESSNNQWKLTLPLQVVYQNDKEKVTQLLNINLTVGRKITGDLGIMQMVAAPRTVVTQQPAPTVDQTAVQTPTNTNDTTATTVAPSSTETNTAATPASNETTKPTTGNSNTSTSVTPATNSTTTVTPTPKGTTSTTTTPTNSNTTTTPANTPTTTPTTPSTTTTTTPTSNNNTTTTPTNSGTGTTPTTKTTQ